VQDREVARLTAQFQAGSLPGSALDEDEVRDVPPLHRRFGVPLPPEVPPDLPPERAAYTERLS
jgi:hypothetical protein